MVVVMGTVEQQVEVAVAVDVVAANDLQFAPPVDIEILTGVAQGAGGEGRTGIGPGLQGGGGQRGLGEQQAKSKISRYRQDVAVTGAGSPRGAVYLGGARR